MSEPTAGYGVAPFVGTIVPETGYPRYVYRAVPDPAAGDHLRVYEWRDTGAGLTFVGPIITPSQFVLGYIGATGWGVGCDAWQTSTGYRMVLSQSQAHIGNTSDYPVIHRIDLNGVTETPFGLGYTRSLRALKLEPSDSIMVAFRPTWQSSPNLPPEDHIGVQLLDLSINEYFKRPNHLNGIDTGFVGHLNGGMWLTSGGRVGLCYSEEPGGEVVYETQPIYCIFSDQSGEAWGNQALVTPHGTTPQVLKLSPSDSVMVAYFGEIIDPDIDAGVGHICVRVMDPSGSSYAPRGAEVDTGVDGRAVEYLWLLPDGRVQLSYIDADNARQTLYSDASGSNWTP